MNMKSERINELLKIQSDIVYHVANDVESGYAYLQSEWAKLDEDDKELILPKILEGCSRVINNPGEINHKKEIFCRAAIKFLSDDSQGKTLYDKLSLAPNVKDIQVAKLFYELKTRGVIENTNEEIASVLQNVF